MLLDWAKTENGQKEASNLICNLQKYSIKKYAGEKITSDNFLKYELSFCKYKLNGKIYKGFFTKKDINDIFKILDYYPGHIISLTG